MMFIKKTILSFCLVLLCLSVFSQKKYQGLLWEISGNGLRKPSYIYGTMHVSNKMAFRLGEPFYKAISEVDVVALELNPDTWFEDFVATDEYTQSTGLTERDYNGYKSKKNSGFLIENNSNRFLKNAFAYDPSIINNLMYRYSRGSQDFEEATFLDLYIYKCGKKMGKKIAGVQSLDDLNAAMERTMHPIGDEKDEEVPLNPKDRISGYLSREKLEEAYRSADLDLLDSISRISRTKAEGEYLLYRRNKVMGAFADSVMKKQRLFMGVGAGHLPGPKGVIEWLRAKGYTVKPVDMGERDADRRAQLDSMVYEQKMQTCTSRDSFYSVLVPGKLHDMIFSSEESAQLGADPVNGAYYSVYRIRSASYLTGESDEQVYKSIDSVLYEYVPGDIITKKKIEKSGYKGYDITNRTRRGDLQRYEIFVTPDEIVFFKLSGTGNFAGSPQADRFFASIRMKPGENNRWRHFRSPDKSFTTYAPANATAYYSSEINSADNRFMLLASDSSSGNRYFVFKHIYYLTDYIEQDSFEIADIDESFSEGPKYKAYSHSMTTYDGRPALRVKYSTPDNRHIEAMMLLNQRNYYIVGVFYKNDSSSNSHFIDSFHITNVPYDSFYWFVDTNLRCKVKLPYKPKSNRPNSSYNSYNIYGYTANNERKKSYYKPGNDETVNASYYIYNKYVKTDDTTYLKRVRKTLSLNFQQVLSNEKLTKTKDGWVLDALVTDTASTMQIRKRWILKNGTRYAIQSYIDPVTGESDFSKTFFASFTPQDTAIGLLPWVPKGGIFLKDLVSKDSLTQDMAITGVGEVEFDDNDLDALISTIKHLPKIRKSEEVKRDLLASFSTVRSQKAIDFLKSEYAKYTDSVDYEGAILSSLTHMRTDASIKAFKELILNEQPVGGSSYLPDGNFFPLIDSPELAKGLFPDMYALLTIDEYKEPIYKLLAAMVDRGLMKPDQYRDKELSILTDAKLTYKRHKSANSNKRYRSNDDDEGRTAMLKIYNTLLIPFADSPQVRTYLNKVLLNTTPDVRAATATLMYKHGQALPDTIWTSIASAKDKGLLTLYDQLKEDTLLKLLPPQFKNPQKFADEMAHEYLRSNNNYNSWGEIENEDSVQLLYHATARFDQDTGIAYYYKIKTDKGKFWKTRIIGVHPVVGETFKTFNELYTKEDYYLDENKEVKEQFDTALKEILKFKAQNRNAYYNFRYDYTRRTYD